MAACTDTSPRLEAALVGYLRQYLCVGTGAFLSILGTHPASKYPQPEAVSVCADTNQTYQEKGEGGKKKLQTQSLPLAFIILISKAVPGISMGDYSMKRAGWNGTSGSSHFRNEQNSP